MRPNSLYYLLLLSPFCLLLRLPSGNGAGQLLRFTNIECSSFYKNITDFRQCELKVLKRGSIALNIYCKLLLRKVDNITLKLELLRKTNDYTPYLYSFNVDFCDFERSPTRNPVLNTFYQLIKSNSNINHSCPYDHDIVVRNMILPNELNGLMPFPKGEYLISIQMALYNVWVVAVKAFASVIAK